MSDDRVTARQAMERANEANHKIDSHEDICSVRYDSLDKTMKRIEALQLDQDRKMDGIYTRLWWFAGSVGACMFAVIMALVFRG